MNSTERANFDHLVADIAWFGLAFAATNRFLSVYAIHLGASPFLQGLIVSLPALVLLLSTGFSGWWRRRFSSTLDALWLPAFGFRLVFLLPAFTPFFPLEFQPVWLVLAVTLPALPQGIAGVIFLILMREAVGDDKMTLLTSRRTLALNITLAVSAVFFGFWLEGMPFPFNYQVMFTAAFGLTLVSQWHVMRVRVISPAEMPRQTRESNAWRDRRFLTFAGVMAASYTAFFAIIAVTPLYLVKGMGATEGYMAWFGLVELAAGTVASSFIHHLVHRYGNRVVTATSMVGTALAGVIFAIAPDLNAALIGAAVSGAAWTGASVSIFSMFVERTPAGHMTSWTVGFQQVTGMATFVGPLLGSTLANFGVSLIAVLMFGASLRLIAAVVTLRDATQPKFANPTEVAGD